MYKVGDKVICISPADRELTEDKEYEIKEVIENTAFVKVINDLNKLKQYIWIRFVKKDEI